MVSVQYQTINQIIKIIKGNQKKGKNLIEECALWAKSLEVNKDRNKYNLR